MFFTNKLQHYPVFEDVFRIFTASSTIIPFADLHHYKIAAKTITDSRYRSFIDTLQNHLILKKTGDHAEHNYSDFVAGEEIPQMQKH